jgi:hypothetical protein
VIAARVPPPDGPDYLASLRRRLWASRLQHLALLAALGSGLLLMRVLGWRLDHARWLALKLGLVAFLLVPLEAMHAYVANIWVARGLARTRGSALATGLSRGLGIEAMIRTLAVPLFGIGVPLILWLSIARPF